MYVVASYTMGSFREFATDPLDTLAEAEDFCSDPPAVFAPRPQDSLRILELTEPAECGAAMGEGDYCLLPDGHQGDHS